MELHDQIETVRDQQSFLVFVEALINDHQGAVGKAKVEFPSPDPVGGGWRNLGIANFLDAAVSWAKTARTSRTPTFCKDFEDTHILWLSSNSR